MSKYCPYTDSDVVYLECQDCDRKICGENVFFCLVVGSRSFTDYDLLKTTLDNLIPNSPDVVIVSGGADGTDSLAERYAKEKNFPMITFPADWKKFGKSAGYIRNEEMHRFLSKQNLRMCVAFWDGKSRGTQHSFRLSKQFGTQLKLIRT